MDAIRNSAAQPGWRIADRSWLASGWLRIACAVLFAVPIPAVNAQEPSGLLYFAVEDLDNGRVVYRGTADEEGAAFRQVNLAPNTKFRLWVMEADTLRTGGGTFTTPGAGQTYTYPDVTLGARRTHDSDRDGLPDLGEFIVGTDGNDVDTDGDGVSDGAEVTQGLDPLSGRPVRTGVVGTVGTPGFAVHVFAFNDLAVVADFDRGIAVFNIFNTMNPVIIAQVDTPGTAIATSFSTNLVAVADSAAGLAVVDITDPPAARITRQFDLGASVKAVTTVVDTAYAVLDDGRVMVVDMAGGTVFDQFTLPDQADDVAVAGDVLLILTRSTLYLYDLLTVRPELLGSLAVSGTPSPQEVGRKLFAGGGLAYVGYFTGYSVIDVTDPTNPMLVGSPPATQEAVHDITANGSGLVATITSTGGPSTQFFTLYDGSDPSDVTRIISSLDTPGVARATSLYNGLGYVAAESEGLQVVNYLAFDTLDQAPTVSLATSGSGGAVEEGKLYRVSAEVSDDVQVRNVEFYVDGERVATDGNFPFEVRFVTPTLTPGSTSFTLRARASDTGGNFAFSDELVIDLLPDATPPIVVRTVPGTGAIIGSLDTLASLSAVFNEPIDPATLDASSFRLAEAGPDQILGTGDDLPVSGGEASYRENLNTAVLSFPGGLSPGLYRAFVGPPVSDVAGNVMNEDFSWNFRSLAFVDSDGDGLPDDVEATLGLDPLNSDTDGDGAPDGNEDFDNDGLSNAGEILLGTDLQVTDSDGDGTNDGDEDRDNDALTDSQEVSLGTNPFAIDSDGDGWPDEAELTVASDPLNPDSVPELFVSGVPSAHLLSLGLASSDGFGTTAVATHPPTGVLVLGLPAGDGSGSTAVSGDPPVEVTIEGP